MKSRFIRLGIATLAIALVTAACGDKNEIGGDLKADGSTGGANAIGQATTTTAAPVTTAAPTATTIKPTVTTVAVPVAVYKVQDDNKGQYLEPLNHSVRAGELVRFVNEDDTAHTMVLKSGGSEVYKSPVIAPGGTWDLRPTQKGTFDVVDMDRTYAVGGSLTVR